MKKLLLLSILLLLFIQKSFSQIAHQPGPVEQRMTDSLCSCITKLDASKMTNKEQATAAYTECVEKHIDLLTALADERKVDIGDQQSMEKVGIDLALNLLKEECKGFKQIALLMGSKEGSNDSGTTGTFYGNFKRIDNKGLNYFIITDKDKKEKSFIWLRQFPGSENFMNGGIGYIGKRMKIKYQEMEVYLPQAKGYYKVKEIVSLSVE